MSSSISMSTHDDTIRLVRQEKPKTDSRLLDTTFYQGETPYLDQENLDTSFPDGPENVEAKNAYQTSTSSPLFEPDICPQPLRIVKTTASTPRIVNDRPPILPRFSSFSPILRPVTADGLPILPSRPSSSSPSKGSKRRGRHRRRRENTERDDQALMELKTGFNARYSPSEIVEGQRKLWRSADALIVRKQRSNAPSPQSSSLSDGKEQSRVEEGAVSFEGDEENHEADPFRCDKISPASGTHRRAPMVAHFTRKEILQDATSMTTDNKRREISPETGERLLRKPSTRTRVLAHFLGGLDVLRAPLAMPSTTTTTTTTETTLDERPLIRPSHLSTDSIDDSPVPSLGDRNTLLSRSRSTTATSSQTDFSSRSALAAALAAFPLPPNVKASISEDSIPDGCGNWRRDPGTADEKAVITNWGSTNALEPPVLAARIRVFPEAESKTTEPGQSLWVGIEVTGEIVRRERSARSSSSSSPSPALSGQSLDAVICIDNRFVFTLELYEWKGLTWPSGRTPHLQHWSGGRVLHFVSPRCWIHLKIGWESWRVALTKRGGLHPLAS